MSNSSTTNCPHSSPAAQLTSVWLRPSTHLIESTLQLNQQLWRTVASPTVVPSASPTHHTEQPQDPDQAQDSAQQSSQLPGLAYTLPEWTVERSLADPVQLSVGDTIRFTTTIDDATVKAFARDSGDTNRLHLDESFAERTRFDGRVVHGTLGAGLISAALARLPGLPIYLSQDLAFLAPIEIGTPLTATVEVLEALGEARYRLATTVTTTTDQPLIEGDAVILLDPLPAIESPDTA